jgi:hypothetical protein
MSDEEAADAEVQQGDEPIQKRYRRYHSVEFHDNLLVSVMIIVKAYGRVDLPFVHWMLLDEWHVQIKDETKHPRPRGFDLYTATQNFCCFKNHAEWMACNLLSKGRGREKRGENAVFTGDVPTLTTHYQDWAAKKFTKWQDIARDMQNNIHPKYVRQHFLFRNVIAIACSHSSFAVQLVQKQTAAFRFRQRRDCQCVQAGFVRHMVRGAYQKKQRQV